MRRDKSNSVWGIFMVLALVFIGIVLRGLTDTHAAQNQTWTLDGLPADDLVSGQHKPVVVNGDPVDIIGIDFGSSTNNVGAWVRIVAEGVFLTGAAAGDFSGFTAEYFVTKGSEAPGSVLVSDSIGAFMHTTSLNQNGNITEIRIDFAQSVSASMRIHWSAMGTFEQVVEL